MTSNDKSGADQVSHGPGEAQFVYDSFAFDEEPTTRLPASLPTLGDGGGGGVWAVARRAPPRQ